MNFRGGISSLFSGFQGGAGSWRSLLQLSLYFLAIALPLMFYLRTYDSGTTKQLVLSLTVLAGFAALGYGVLEEGRLALPASVLSFFAPAFLLLLWNALRFPYAPYPAPSFDGFIRQENLLLSFLFVLLAFTGRNLRRAVIAVISGWFITVLFGLVQRLGLDPFIWNRAFGERIFSTLGNPNLFAAYQALCLPLLTGLVIDDKFPAWARFFAAGAAVLGSFTLAWTFAPLEIGVFMAAAAVYMLIVLRALRGGRRNMALALAALCVAVSLGVSFGNISRSGELRRESTFILETWKGTWELVKTKPWLGYGPGSFRPLYPAFRRPEAILVEHAHNSETAHPQNELLEQWTGGGLPAVLLWLWLFGVLLYKGWKTLAALPTDTENTIYLPGIYAAFTGGILIMMGLTAARFPAHTWLVFFMAGLIGAAQRTGPEETEPVFVLPLPFGSWRRYLHALLLPVVLLPAWGAVRIFRSDMHHNTALFWSKKGEWTKALEGYDREVWGAPNYIMGQYFKASVFKKRNAPGDTERALEQFRFVRALSPDYVQVHSQEAEMLLRLGRKQEAIKSLEIQARLDPVSDWPWFTLAGLYREAGEPEKATLAEQKFKEAQAAWEKSAPPAKK